MTTELEKQFFDTFRIEPKKIYLCPRCKTKLSGCTWVGDKQRFECLYSWGEHPYYMGKEVEEKAIIGYEYPQISDKHYLELICVLNQKAPVCKSVSLLKETILKQLIRLVSDDYLWITDGAKEEYNHQVQAIFERG